MSLAPVLALERLVGPLDEPSRDLVAPALLLRDFEPGHAITSEGTPPRHLVLLLAGRARLSKRRPDGAQAVVAYVRPVSLIGHASVVGRADYLLTAMAVEPCHCLLVPARLLRQRDTEVARRMSVRLLHAAVLGMVRQLRAANAHLLSIDQPTDVVDRLAGDLGSWCLPDRC